MRGQGKEGLRRESQWGCITWLFTSKCNWLLHLTTSSSRKLRNCISDSLSRGRRKKDFILAPIFQLSKIASELMTSPSFLGCACVGPEQGPTAPCPQHQEGEQGRQQMHLVQAQGEALTRWACVKSIPFRLLHLHRSDHSWTGRGWAALGSEVVCWGVWSHSLFHLILPAITWSRCTYIPASHVRKRRFRESMKFTKKHWAISNQWLRKFKPILLSSIGQFSQDNIVFSINVCKKYKYIISFSKKRSSLPDLPNCHTPKSHCDIEQTPMPPPHFQ